MNGAHIEIDITPVGGNDYGVHVRCRPLLPTLELAGLFEQIAREIRQGRMEALRINPAED